MLSISVLLKCHVTTNIECVSIAGKITSLAEIFEISKHRVCCSVLTDAVHEYY